MNPVESLIKSMLPMASLAIPLMGASAHAPVERALTVPEKDIRALCKGMSEEDTLEVIGSFRRIADELSDTLGMIASKGKVQPD